ncbi:hypothetical protein [Enterocloster bolteae]|jgi:hypothetical protein|uniref:Uncharacterized protein n=1 Tax=Enterocloster bolteae 90B8 TaxID=997897 RepID=R0AS17_9FIRM|nr:hypothetical protein [Enterocloster bolteae]ENZ34852.1 hypothetical protein HMPREF1097_04242 [Enterocloster bolteae 90B8]MBS6094176.1 hypothetical protein [Enterocloster bolteae]RGO83553.1 hypothetical protein DXB04_16575 [Enterocloster bolteae]
MIILKLHNDVTPEKLIKAGFRQQSENKLLFRMRDRLYKDTISLSIKIDLSKEPDEQIEWYVIDNNTGMSYSTFYFTPNTCKDLVRDTVYKTLREVINELDKREVLYMEGEYDGNKSSPI